MARFKRWTHGFVASIDSMIVQVENHEALATSALRDLEQGVARSKVQLMRVERDGVRSGKRWPRSEKPACAGASAPSAKSRKHERSSACGATSAAKRARARADAQASRARAHRAAAQARRADAWSGAWSSCANNATPCARVNRAPRRSASSQGSGDVGERRNWRNLRALGVARRRDRGAQRLLASRASTASTRSSWTRRKQPSLKLELKR